MEPTKIRAALGTSVGRSVAALVAIVLVITPVYRLQGLSWGQAAAASIAFVLPCVLLVWATRRVLAQGTVGWTLPHVLVMHAALGLGFSSLWTIVFCGFVYLALGEVPVGFLMDGALWQFVWGFVIYAALVQVSRLQARLKERQLAAANAELQALRARLHPHFLFNTLHSLTQLAREDPEATEHALEKFGELMRYVLDAGGTAVRDVSLQNEMRFVRNYLALERLRLGERLQVTEDIAPEALDLALPPLALQPLVENAVRHGLAPRGEGGHLRLTARVANGRLALEVADDGPGAAPNACRGRGLGLQAVERQLKARFAVSGKLDIMTRPNAGFIVRVEIPAQIFAEAL